MKKAFMLLSVLTMFAFKAFAQDDVEILKKDEATGDYYYEEVVTTDGLKQDELFKRAKAWILANMKTADNNITFDEKNFSAVNTGAMNVKKKNFFGAHPIQDGAFDFKFHIWCKDGRYKIRIDNIMFYLLINLGNGMGRKTLTYQEAMDHNKYDKHLKNESNTKLNTFISVFKQDMAKSPSEVKQNNDW